MRDEGRLREIGFTLLELIVVIFIISLTAALVFPSFYGIGEKRVPSDAKKIASLLRYLNDNAIAAKVTYSVTFDFRDSLVSWKGPEGEKSEKIMSLSSLTLPSRGEIKDGEVKLFFGPLGASENIDVLLKDEEETMTVTFSPVSGRVKILTKDEG